MLNVDADRWLEEYRRAWVELDPDAAAALFTEDALYREQPYDEPKHGSAGVREYWAEVTATQEDVELVYGTPISVGATTAVEWWVRMRNGGEDVTLAGSLLLHFADDGRCRELREYWHYSPGRVAPPAGWGE